MECFSNVVEKSVDYAENLYFDDFIRLFLPFMQKICGKTQKHALWKTCGEEKTVL